MSSGPYGVGWWTCGRADALLLELIEEFSLVEKRERERERDHSPVLPNKILGISPEVAVSEDHSIGAFDLRRELLRS